jgi:hypothetical protein
MTENDENQHQTGYRRPPKHTRWKTGQSGNPRGRPRGSRNLPTIIQDELNAKIVVTENGRQRSIRKREAIVKQLVNRGAKGDLKAIDRLIAEDSRYHGVLVPAGIAEATEEDSAEAATIANLLTRIRGSVPHDGSPENASSMASDTDSSESPASELERGETQSE